MKGFLSVFVLSFCLLCLSSCKCSGGKNRTDSQWTRDMSKQHSVKAQEGSNQGEILMNVPPEGTRARNRSYYPYSKDPEMAGKRLKNPLPKKGEVLSLGEKNYKRYCIYCHGSLGDSKMGANVAPKMAVKPASLLSERAKALSDGRLYHIIYEGQGLMGSYRIQLETGEQALMSRYMKEDGTYKGSSNIWSVVHYVRYLQRKQEKRGRR